LVFLGQSQEDGQKLSFPLLGWVTSFSLLNLKSSLHLLISDKSLTGVCSHK
jgi:hypothetical protein